MGREPERARQCFSENDYGSRLAVDYSLSSQILSLLQTQNEGELHP